jgi:hypothetical protein
MAPFLHRCLSEHFWPCRDGKTAHVKAGAQLGRNLGLQAGGPHRTQQLVDPLCRETLARGDRGRGCGHGSRAGVDCLQRFALPCMGHLGASHDYCEIKLPHVSLRQRATFCAVRSSMLCSWHEIHTADEYKHLVSRRILYPPGRIDA